MKSQLIGVSFFVSKGVAEHLSALGSNNNIPVALGELIYNPVVISTLFSRDFVQIFFPLIILPPALRLSTPPFWCLHLSNICR